MSSHLLITSKIIATQLELGPGDETGPADTEPRATQDDARNKQTSNQQMKITPAIIPTCARRLLYPRQAGSQTTKAWVILSPVLMLLHVCITLLSPALEALSPAADNSGITR